MKYQNWIKIIGSLLFLYYVSRMIDWEYFGSGLSNTDIGIMLLVLLFTPINLVMRAYRFQVILNDCSGKHFTLWDAVKLYLIGYSLNLVMPASGGDLGRSYYGYKQYGVKEEMLSSSFLDLTFGFQALFVFGLWYSIKWGFSTYIILSVLVLIASSTVIFFPGVVPWGLIERLAKKFKIELKAKNLLKGTVLRMHIKLYAIALSIVGWGLTLVQYFLIAKMFRIDTTFSFTSSVFPPMLLARWLPIAVNGIGTQEAVTTYLFSLGGLTATDAVLVSLTMTLTFAIIPGLAGLYWVLKTKY